MRKIVISLSKGGVAKSSTAVALAHGLALQKKRVLIIDTDDQGQDAFLLGVKPTLGLAEVLNEEVQAKDAIFETRPNLWILSGGKSLAGVKRSISRKDFGAEQTLSEALKPLDGQFDFVILDTSPSWDALTINSLFYAQEVLTPVSLEVLTINSLIEFVQRLEAVQRFNKPLLHRYVLPTFYDGRVKKSAEILEQLQKHFPEQLCDPINYNVRISESAGFGQTIFEYAPKSPGAKDYTKLVNRILEDEQTTYA
jgi:chromosome partitioning protein